MCAGQRGGFGGIPCRHVRESKIADLARAHQITQRLQNLLDWRDTIPRVHPIQINVIGAQPFERGFQCRVHIFAAIAARIHIARFRTRPGKFGSQHNLIA